MFAVPIDQSGLAGFVPVRRQSGSSIGLQDLGFDIFGRPIGTGTTDIGSTDIGGTDIGQIEQPVKFSPRIDIDQHGIDPDADPPGIPTEGPEVSFPDFVDAASKGLQSLPEAVTSFVSDIFDEDKYSYNPEEGFFGTAEIAGKSFDVLGKGANFITSGLLATTKAAPFASLFGDMVEGAVTGKGLNATNVAFSLAKAAAAFVAPPLVPILTLVNLFANIFGDDDVDDAGPGPGGLGSTPGDPVDTAMAGLGIGFGPGAEYGYDNPYGDLTIDEHTDFGTIANNINNAIAEAAQQVAEEEAVATPVASDDQGDPSGGSDPSDQATDSDESGDVW